jgi:hypothetical protein
MLSYQSTVIDTQTGLVRTGQTVTYFGLPIIGFAAQSYTNGAVSVGGISVLSNYGGQFNHKCKRRIEVAQ